jgi:hypothetical protein
LLRLANPVVELRRKLVAPEGTPGSEDEPIPLPDPETQHLAVCRIKLTIEHHKLDPRAFALLSKLCRSMPLGTACESAASELSLSPEALAAELESWFATWTARGYFVDLLL